MEEKKIFQRYISIAWLLNNLPLAVRVAEGNALYFSNMLVLDC
jgi:hypothetical protein